VDGSDVTDEHSDAERCARLGACARSTIFMLVYMGAWAAGSAFLGYVAGNRSTHFSFLLAAIGTAVSPVLILISRLPNTAADLAAWDHWRKPMLVGEVDLHQGPVLVTVEYEIEAKDSDEFLGALEEFSRVRRRDGASRWGVYYDTENPTRYVETFRSNRGRSTCGNTPD